MKLVVGLGNPGERYSGTRHNVGFAVIDQLIKMWDLEVKPDKKFESLKALVRTESTEIMLAKPQTFMNRSGLAVQRLVNFYRVGLSELYVVHDDLDIKLGSYKIQLGKGPKIHNGLSSIYLSLGSKDFWHVRIGVDSRTDGLREISGERYVLQTFDMKEFQTVESVIDQVSREIIEKLIEKQ